MGILKIRIRGHGSDDQGQQSCILSTSNDLAQEDEKVNGEDHSNGSDSDELVDMGCETAMVEGQLCDIPYELYGLPDLADILSVETWNSYLTEEERYFLSAYLPDMDQEMFWLNMKELLGCNNIFFGSPVKEFFWRLRGGLYSPKVAYFRDGINFLQRQMHYHSLRSYHESMSRTFMDMKKAWSECHLKTGVDERLCIWRNLKNPKPVFMVDLNADPVDEGPFSSKDEKEASSITLSKRIKCMKGNGQKMHTVPPMVDPLQKTKPRGVLKIKAAESNLTQNNMIKIVAGDTWATCRPGPRGVLKRKPRDINASDKGKTLHGLSIGQQGSTALFESHGFPAHGFPPLPQSIPIWDIENFHEGSPYPLRELRGGKNYRDPEWPDSAEIHGPGLNNITEQSREQQIPFRKVKPAKGLRVRSFQQFDKGSFSSRDSHNVSGSSLETAQHEECWSRGNSGQLNREAFLHSDELFQYPSKPYQGRGLPRTRHGGAGHGGLQNAHNEQLVSEGHREFPSLPITYKRKKSHLKLNPLDSINQSTAIAKFRSRVITEEDGDTGERALKTQLKIWKDYDASHHQSGLLSSSPSI
ncbi:hypothetical protein QJS10_CPA05g02166 [Acorus calamus]|uniref:DEUBAD domain-containing protein n=1 Tax=Acorus calamus TaxID=4465 RepID=A0AAV9EWN6_ACOCL|nr:hypothetical protein QJS10_CPA05g02166 [Acorus calamus]